MNPEHLRQENEQRILDLCVARKEVNDTDGYTVMTWTGVAIFLAFEVAWCFWYFSSPQSFWALAVLAIPFVQIRRAIRRRSLGLKLIDEQLERCFAYRDSLDRKMRGF